MARPRKLDPAIEAMLVRVARTGLTDQQVHERAGLSAGVLSQIRKGRYGPGAGTVKKLLRWLDRFESGEGSSGATPPKPSRVENASAMSGAGASETTSRWSDLVELVYSAKTAKALDRAARELSRAGLLASEGELERIQAVLSILKERRQLIKARKEERAAAQVRALEILTPGEAKVLAAHRLRVAGPYLEPGEGAQPPPLAEPEVSAPAPAAAS